MKIGIITFHGAYNFGSVLQAYALQTYLENYSKNIQCEIINYRSQIQRGLYEYPWKRYESLPVYWSKIVLLHSRKEKQKRFEAFMKDYLHLTDEMDSTEDLTDEKLKCDWYVCGSDQIWNCRAADATEAYYLPLIRGDKKVSYAASFGAGGGYNLSEQQSQLDTALYYIKGFKRLSVRESAGGKLLKEKIGRDSEVLLDPTLLLSGSDWDPLTKSDIKLESGKFILFYTIGYTEKEREMALFLGRKYNVPVVVTILLHSKELMDIKLIKETKSGPNDFLWLVKNARCVFTTSFHGTAFSIIFHKEFWSYVGEKDERKTTLLKSLHLEERAVFASDSFPDKVFSAVPIEWDDVDRLIAEQRSRTDSFFTGVFGEEKAK